MICWEFGRTPSVEFPNREPEPRAWGGTTTTGASPSGWPEVESREELFTEPDDFGYRAEENPVRVHDLHAILLHLWVSIMKNLPADQNSVNEAKARFSFARKNSLKTARITQVVASAVTAEKGGGVIVYPNVS